MVVVVVVDDVFLSTTKASSSLSDELSPPKPLRGLPRLTTILGGAIINGYGTPYE